MAAFDSPVPEKGNRSTLEDCGSDKSDHGGGNGRVDNVAYHYELGSWEDVQVQEDERHLCSAD